MVIAETASHTVENYKKKKTWSQHEAEKVSKEPNLHIGAWGFQMLQHKSRVNWSWDCVCLCAIPSELVSGH